MIRVGIGYDSHRLVPGRQLILGGQHVPFERGLEGHSDADCVAHAVIDALLGAAGAGDIGTLFPDTDPKWAGADSLFLLHTAVQHIRRAGFAPLQADITVIADAPKITEYKAAIAQAIARILEVEAGLVSVKGKTNEGMGFIGRGEGIAVIAVATVEAR